MFSLWKIKGLKDETTWNLAIKKPRPVSLYQRDRGEISVSFNLIHKVNVTQIKSINAWASSLNGSLMMFQS